MSVINHSEDKDEVKAGEGTDWGDVASNVNNLAKTAKAHNQDDTHNASDGGNDKRDNTASSVDSEKSNIQSKPATSTAIKPGDMGGESGHTVSNSTKAGVDASQKSVEASVNAAKTAAETGAEIGKEAAETGASVAEAAAEGAAEGSVVPGVGTVVVAALRVAWSLRKVFFKVAVCILIALLIPICSLETLGRAMWTNAFNDDGTEKADSSIISVYEELEATVQGVIDSAYAETLDKAKAITKQSAYSTYPEFNEIRNISGGSALTTDICDVIATFTVMCQVENKEPTAKYLKKCLEKRKSEFFPTSQLEMLKFYYNTYEMVDISTETQYQNPVVGVLTGEQYESCWAEHGFPLASDLDRYDSRLLGGEISVWWGPFVFEGSSQTNYYAVSDNALYRVSGKQIASNDGKPEQNQYIILKGYVQPTGFIILKSGNFNIVDNDEQLYTPTWEYNAADPQNSMKTYETHWFSTEGSPCVRVTVYPFNRDAMMSCFDVDKFATYPLISDADEIDDNGKIVKRTTYSPNEYTCGMAITDYTDVLKEEIYGAKYGIAPADGVMKYEYKIATVLGTPIPGVTVSMYSDSSCSVLVQTALTDDSGIATFKGFNKQVYYFKETAKGSNTPLLYSLKLNKTKLDNTDGHCMTWEFKVSEKGYICPLQIADDTEKIAITSFFGYRTSPTAGASTMHGGLDMCVHSSIGTNLTQGRPIRAAKAGTVVESEGSSGGYGYYIEIKHEDGFTTLYAHNSQLCVNSGDKVIQGQIIAYAGGTPGTPGAGTSTGAHCHFEVRNPDGTKLNPLNFLPINYN